eukprot:gnl/Spiro4/21826_TR10709_c0_g1_i1.p1 gnl/Spiro4/21826_TR10709_c0_g1~~gnl/Spiro4/21826_TR10709_c0_g1_i1.p1  ORF type:complete len:451 (-),score=77.21 gnl/Spiro4/21826_TR10709_c0_g1_i1:212-1564(-)
MARATDTTMSAAFSDAAAFEAAFAGLRLGERLRDYPSAVHLLRKAENSLSELTRFLDAYRAYQSYLAKRSIFQPPPLGYFSLLPCELLPLCLPDLSTTNVGVISLVCREWHRLARELCCEFVATNALRTRIESSTSHSRLSLLTPVRELIRKYPNVVHINLKQLRCSLKAIPNERLPFLRTICAALGPTTSLTALKVCSSLSALDVSHCHDVHSLSSLSACTRLQSLKIAHTSVSSVAPLANSTALTLIDLSSTPLYDIAPLGALRALRKVKLGNTFVCDVSPLAGCTQLSYLGLSSTPVVASSLAAVTAVCTTLRQLYLAHTTISDVQPLAHLHLLEYLSLSHTPVTRLCPLVPCTSLRDLYLRDTPHLKDLNDFLAASSRLRVSSVDVPLVLHLDPMPPGAETSSSAVHMAPQHNSAAAAAAAPVRVLLSSSPSPPLRSPSPPLRRPR